MTRGRGEIGIDSGAGSVEALLAGAEFRHRRKRSHAPGHGKQPHAPRRVRRGSSVAALATPTSRPISHPVSLAVGRLRTLGAMAELAGACLGAMARPTRARRRELIRQSAVILRSAMPAAMLSIAAWGFAGPGLQAGNFLVTFGSIDRSGGFMVVAIVREFGTYVTATVVAGVVGTMFTAELGARRVRGELDALSVLGVDPVKDLIAPRVLALILTMLGLDLFALVFGVLGGYLATTLVLGGTEGAFMASFFANTTPADVIASLVKVGIFGALIGVICAYHGLNVTGGPAGVGRAVNRAIVGCLIAIFVVNLIYTQWFLASFPSVGVFK
ncbi:MAG: MlaE family ABC transporter permease [Solirubrobacteraceae bacterium]